MLRSRRWMYALGVLALLGTARPLAAQTTIGLDAGLYSKYVWRGLTFTNKPVIQPDIWVSFPISSAALTVGAWFNIEPTKYDGNNDISEGGGAAGPDVAEFDWWADITKTFGTATVTVGATGYRFPNDFGYTSASNTVEIYGKLALGVPILSPKINAYYDVDKVKGLYVEGSISHSVPVSPAVSITFGVLAGWSNGMQPSSDKSFNFADDGLTHVDVSASTGFSLGPLSVAPQFHFVINADNGTRFNSPKDFNEGTKVWFGAAISWSKSFGGSE